MGTADQEAGPGNILVSAGVRVLKVPKRRVIELSPRGHMETFEENFNPKHRLVTINPATILILNAVVRVVHLFIYMVPPLMIFTPMLAGKNEIKAIFKDITFRKRKSNFFKQRRAFRFLLKCDYPARAHTAKTTSSKTYPRHPCIIEF